VVQVCRKFSLEHFNNVKNIVPILSNSNQCKIQGCLTLHDQSNIPKKMRELIVLVSEIWFINLNGKSKVWRCLEVQMMKHRLRNKSYYYYQVTTNSYTKFSFIVYPEMKRITDQTTKITKFVSIWPSLFLV
jgi:hypothetical protein